MAALLIALLGALAVVGLGDVRVLGPGAVAAEVGVLLVWGAAVVLLPAPRGGPARLLLAALAVRLILLAAPPTLSDDLYRYLWEGRVVALGENPFLHAPGWAGWPEDAIRARVNHPELTTIYPPLALWSFAGLASLWYDPLAIKLAFGLADAGVALGLARVLAGRGRSGRGAWIYALHPLGAVESAGSGHLEAAAIGAMVLAIGAWDRERAGQVKAGWALIFATAGAGLKLLPGAILPTLLRGPGQRGRRRALAVAAALAVGAAGLPWVAAGPGLLRGFGAYAGSWSFNGSIYPLLQAALGEGLARPVAVAAGAAVVGWAWLRRRDPAEVALWAGGAFVLLSPTVHPWYVGWAWVPALICGVRSWTVLATTAPLAYAVLATWDPATGAWQEMTWTRWAVYLPFLAAMALECAWRWTSPGPWAPGRRAQT